MSRRDKARFGATEAMARKTIPEPRILLARDVHKGAGHA